jgi:trk system potassium uptake protein TrkA
MYIIVVGGGKLGMDLVEHLRRHNHEITVIEKDPARCKRIAENPRLLVISGDGTETRYLEDANCSSADVLAALTDKDEDNLVACRLAKTVYRVPKVVARLNDQARRRVFEAFQIDIVFDSTEILAELIHESLAIRDLIHLTPIARGKLQTLKVTIDNKAIAGKKLLDLGLAGKGILVVSILRGGELFIPSGATALQLKDDLIVVLTPEAVGDFKRIMKL